MSHRRDRASEEIRRELTNLLFEGLPDEETPPVFLDRVEIAPDLSVAKVFVSPSVPDQPYDEKTLTGPLRRAEPWLRKRLFERMRIRRVPKMQFRVDRGKENAERIAELLNRVKKRGGMGVLFFAMLLQPLWGTTLERYEASANVMGSEFRVALYGEEKRRLASIADAAFDEARRVDALLSNYRDDSELSRVNREASDGPVTVSDEFFELLERCLEFSRETEGAFDPTVGRLMKTWGFYRGSGELPGRLSIWWALRRVGYEHLELDAAAKTVAFARSGLELDPGGFGKGYAVERIVELLREHDVRSGMVSAGNSTLYGLGAPPDEPRGWRTEIRDPKDAERVVETVYLRDESLSTSGSYEKFFEVDGVVYSHIMDPRTGRPATGTWAVSVVGASAFETEVWATALFVDSQGPEGVRAFRCSNETPCRWLQ